MPTPLEKILTLVEEKREAAEKCDDQYHRLISEQALFLQQLGKLVAEDYTEEHRLKKIASFFEIDLEEFKNLSIEDYLVIECAYEGESNQ